MLHELGHVWGLDHPWETQKVSWDSIMNYRFKEFHVATVFADDASAVRSAHPGTKIHDGLVSSYSTRYDGVFGAEYLPARPSPAAVSAGKKVGLTGPIQVENPGTVPISRASVEIYLTPDRFSFEGAIKIKTVRLAGTLAPGAARQVKVSKMTIPGSIPRGTWYLGFYLRDSKDQYLGNNSAWSNADVTLEVR
jgi:hypothetical protein